ncbi:hypothetical protein [Alkanindiges illinoisensis]|uniref:Uncharacterized protein n=1 Tax=Alkanindiges illinoisensis TaxID=197183 RepID=A0A4Y7XE87_9GAMM|nr:hypothetical protein [Alkanindiges illinoisensis]TEU30078.1 hypothetical protein E2B99_03285 [Alkanindiges illinoisensis]
MRSIILLSLAYLISGVAHAAPTDDRSGICYTFSGNKLLTKFSCLVSTGYGAGGTYESMKMGKKQFNAEISTCYNQATEETTECGASLNEKDAIHYYRDLFYKKITDPTLVDSRSLSCYQTEDKKTDICVK